PTQAAAAGDRQARVPAESGALAPPRSPADAIASQTSGRGVLRVLVGPDGGVRDVVVEESTPPGVFDAATMEAARQWRFTPAMEDGKAVEGWVRIPVEFDVGGDEPDEGGGGAS